MAERKKVKHKHYSASKIKNKADFSFDENKTYEEEKPKKVKKVKKEKAVKEPVIEENDELFDFEEEVTEKKSSLFSVHEGNRQKRKQKAITIVFVLIVLVAAYAVFSIFLPIGVYDSITNSVATLGSSDYPVDFSSGIILDCVNEGNYYYILSDTTISAYSKSGKEIFVSTHGLSSPMLSTSPTRALLFDQNGNKALIYNLSGLIKTVETKNPIVTANVGRNGDYAIVTGGSEYSSTVTVYSRGGKQIYAWNSVKDIVNNVCISPYGKKVVVSTINASGGKFSSKLSVFDFNSADAIFSCDFGENIVYSLKSAYFGFYAATDENCTRFDWIKYKKTVYNSADKIVDRFINVKDNTFAVFNRANDKTDNVIKLFSTFGKVKTSFEFKDNITDISYYSGRFYILSDTKVFAVDDTGKVVLKGESEFGCSKIIPVNSDSVAAISDDGIKLLNLK